MANSSDIAQLLDSLLASTLQERSAALASAGESPTLALARAQAKALDLRSFQYAFLRPVDELVASVLEAEFPSSREAQFLFHHSRFVESHFRAQIEKYEGTSCCADKTRTVMRILLGFFTTGKEMAFDYEQEYTFHLPRTIFTSHGEIATFFAAVRGLHYGHSEPFVAALQAQAARIAALPPATPSKPKTP